MHPIHPSRLVDMGDYQRALNDRGEWVFCNAGYYRPDPNQPEWNDRTTNLEPIGSNPRLAESTDRVIRSIEIKSTIHDLEWYEREIVKILDKGYDDPVERRTHQDMMRIMTKLSLVWDEHQNLSLKELLKQVGINRSDKGIEDRLDRMLTGR